MISRWTQLLSGALGALTMYYADPDDGRRRRALVRDQLKRSFNRSRDGWRKTARDLSNRVYGYYAELRSRQRSAEVSDDILAQRVRSRIGTAMRHPGSIEVTAHAGQVVLSGPVLSDEVGRLIARVRSVRGVTGIDNRLRVHNEPGNVPGLQGEPGRRSGSRFELMQSNWAPATRLVAGTAGGLLTVYGLRRRGTLGTLAAVGGLTLFSRAAANLELKRLVGLGAGRRAVDIQKSIHIDAPVDRVFGLWADYDNFPRWMSNVREVRKTGDNTSHWRVSGPAGLPAAWEVETTSCIPNELLAWKTRPGSAVQHAGLAHFYANPDGTTTVDIKLSYNPIAGAVGHAVASLLGADPKSQMDQDLARMKTFIETGKVPHDAAQPPRSPVGPLRGSDA